MTKSCKTDGATPSSEQSTGGTDKRGRQRITWQPPTASQREEALQVSSPLPVSLQFLAKQASYEVPLCLTKAAASTAAKDANCLLLLLTKHAAVQHGSISFLHPALCHDTPILAHKSLRSCCLSFFVVHHQIWALQLKAAK